MTAFGHRKVEDVVEVGRDRGEVAGGQVDRLAADTGLLEAGTGGGVGEAGDAPDLVVGRQGPGDGCADLAGDTGDQDFESGMTAIVSGLAPCGIRSVGRRCARLGRIPRVRR
ncbi:hypothetical protein NIIDMKKI_32850 [Mycobacterium kansasii]|uniref:Uncharacterized protein n=1 Tax=Mycobacterium kansasii TaxID=1768 RepID=A0A7G1IES2_MYCKA|nr:hypothetical protein NIIDMKKI_32850 [Mycobacterium kansasii]